MSISILPTLIKVLNSDDKEKVVEVLDAIGFIVFYNQELVYLENARHIYDIMKKYKYDSIVLWKAVICLSAFPLNESIEILKQIKYENYNSILYDEAVRSLKLIGNKA